MQTKISSKGQIVLPSSIRRKLGLHPGDQLEASTEGERIILTRRSARAKEARIVTDAITGLPVLTAGTGAPKLMSRQVTELLAEFP